MAFNILRKNHFAARASRFAVSEKFKVFSCKSTAPYKYFCLPLTKMYVPSTRYESLVGRRCDLLLFHQTQKTLVISES